MFSDHINCRELCAGLCRRLRKRWCCFSLWKYLFIFKHCWLLCTLSHGNRELYYLEFVYFIFVLKAFTVLYLVRGEWDTLPGGICIRLPGSPSSPRHTQDHVPGRFSFLTIWSAVVYLCCIAHRLGSTIDARCHIILTTPRKDDAFKRFFFTNRIADGMLLIVCY